MKHKISKKSSFGISLLRVFYATNAFLFLFASLMFFEYVDMVIFGKTISLIPTTIIRLILIILPVYLAFAIPFHNKETYILAITYHLFFTINGIFTIFYLLNKNLKLKPLLVTIIKPEYETTRAIDLFTTSFQAYAIQIFSIFISTFIIAYLFIKIKNYELINSSMEGLNTLDIHSKYTG